MYMFVFELFTVYIICSHATCKGEGVFLTRVVPSSLVCDSLCTYTTRCGSYTWDAATRSCHLHTQGDTETETMPHAKYLKEAQGMVCRARPCKENEVCVPLEAGTTYVCVASTAATTTTTTTTTTTLSMTPSATTTTTTPPPTTTTTTPPPPTTTTTQSPTTTTTTPSPTTTTKTPSQTTTTLTPPPPTTTTTPSQTTTTTTPSPTTTTTTTTTKLSTTPSATASTNMTTSPTTTTTTPSPTTATTTPSPSTTTTTPSPATTTTTPSPSTTTTTPSPTTTPPTTTTTTPCPVTVNQANDPYTYVGCYNDDKSHVLPHGKLVNGTCLTTETCKLHCHGMNYIFFGLRGGRKCFCGRVIKDGYMKIPDSECNVPCPGDRSTMCGGYGRISIYEIV
ncbi:salivary glue protein Sgs-3-like [Haliotis rufescens]|uniref:salivary glue protein Sgs-3-like n=1 Tax=Haliotis rufescens TaxID=6454 RepID=UPI00201EED1C|nr:salivary glue protein Sgs-3-like [Haliotis rufescens]